MRTPTFVIGGERRSGSSTVAKWIQAHPEIYLHPRMDAGFFLDDEIRGARIWNDGFVDSSKWSQSHSREDYLECFKGVGKQVVAAGEKSADYLFVSKTHARISEMFPEMKFIAILRDPIARAWSHYWNEVGKNRETLGFDEAIEAEPDRCSRSEYALTHLSYVQRGMYDKSLRQLYKVFSPPQVYVLILEELIADPKEELRKLYRFLGVNEDDGYQAAGRHVNQNWTTIPRAFWQTSPLTSYPEKLYNFVVKKSCKLLFRDVYRRRKIQVFLERLTRNSMSDFKLSDKQVLNLRRQFENSKNELSEMLERPLDCWS